MGWVNEWKALSFFSCSPHLKLLEETLPQPFLFATKIPSFIIEHSFILFTSLWALPVNCSHTHKNKKIIIVTKSKKKTKKKKTKQNNNNSNKISKFSCKCSFFLFFFRPMSLFTLCTFVHLWQSLADLLTQDYFPGFRNFIPLICQAG